MTLLCKCKLCGKYWTENSKKYCVDRICRDCEAELQDKMINELEGDGYEN